MVHGFLVKTLVRFHNYKKYRAREREREREKEREREREIWGRSLSDENFGFSSKTCQSFPNQTHTCKLRELNTQTHTSTHTHEYTQTHKQVHTHIKE